MTAAFIPFGPLAVSLANESPLGPCPVVLDETIVALARGGHRLAGFAPTVDCTAAVRRVRANAAPHEIAPDRTGPHRTAPDRTGPDRTGPHRTAPDRTASPRLASPRLADAQPGACLRILHAPKKRVWRCFTLFDYFIGAMNTLSACLRLCALIAMDVPPLIAREPEVELLRQNPSAMFRGEVGRALPVVSLPTHVPAPEGKITLWADFSAADEKGVPLYVVNQTNKEYPFRTQDHDLYVKIEFKDAKGAWRRAQAHMSSWCGNSYYPVTLPARQFFAFRGYRPASGSKHTIRYSVRGGGLASNESEGIVSDADLKAVAFDSMTASEIPFTIWHALEVREDAQFPADRSLQSRAEAIQLLVWYPRNEIAVIRVKELKAKVLALGSGDGRETLVQAMDDYLAKIDAPKPSSEELMQLCIARITDDPAADLSMSKDTAWRLLTAPSPNGDALCSSAKEMEPIKWRRVIEPAVTFMKATKAGTKMGGADAVLSTGSIVDVLVKDDELADWLMQTSSERLRDLGAFALARRSRFDMIVEFAWKQPSPVQLMILKILTDAGQVAPSDGIRHVIRQPSFSGNEHLFWEHCARTMPVETANTIWRWDYATLNNPFNRLFHDPLRDHFKAEAARPSSEVEISPQDAEPLRTALQMLASWRLEEDDAVMTALLKHGAYVKEESWQGDNRDKHVFTKRFIYRQIAKQALIARSQPVPSDLILEEILSSVQEKRVP